MKHENLEMLITMIKIKKLHISGMVKIMPNLNPDGPAIEIYTSVIQSEKTDVKVLDIIIKSEEKK